MLRSKDYEKAARLGLTLQQVHLVARTALRDGVSFTEALRRFQQRRDNEQLAREAKARRFDRQRPGKAEIRRRLEAAGFTWTGAWSPRSWTIERHPGPPPLPGKRKIRRYYGRSR